jgi:hypothetical protein
LRTLFALQLELHRLYTLKNEGKEMNTEEGTRNQLAKELLLGSHSKYFTSISDNHERTLAANIAHTSCIAGKKRTKHPKCFEGVWHA